MRRPDLYSSASETISATLASMSSSRDPQTLLVLPVTDRPQSKPSVGRFEFCSLLPWTLKENRKKEVKALPQVFPEGEDWQNWCGMKGA